MTYKIQKLFFADFVRKMENIMFKKGNDYANEDRLSNFKLAGAISGGSAELNCLNLIATKTARLGVLLNTGKKPDNESISDTILDLANYGVLLAMILGEETYLKTERETMKAVSQMTDKEFDEALTGGEELINLSLIEEEGEIVK
jgi:hypothetical protein